MCSSAMSLRRPVIPSSLSANQRSRSAWRSLLAHSTLSMASSQLVFTCRNQAPVHWSQTSASTYVHMYLSHGDCLMSHTHTYICSCVYLFHRHSLSYVRTSNDFTNELFQSLPYTPPHTLHPYTPPHTLHLCKLL